MKQANLDAAVNLDVVSGNAKMGFYTTSAHAAATVTLRAGPKVLLRETVAINPGKPYTRQVPVPAGIDEHDLVASISDGGRELVSYSPIRLTPEQAPPGVTNPPAPADVKTNEELYLIGLRAQQFHDPANDPMPYWEEALRRDPGDSRVNTVLGITAYTKAKYAEAEKYLRTAIARVTAQFTDPKDVEAIYYLGATLKAEGKTDDAIKMMTGRKFAVAEGANLNVSDQWTNVHILRGQQNIAAKRYQEALVDLQTAVTVPDNLPSRGFGGGGARNAEVAYLTGLAYEGRGDRAKATESWNRATAPAQSGGGRRGGMGDGGPVTAGGSQSYYQALCLEKLGQADKARAMFQSLVDSGQLALKEAAPTEAGRGGRGGAGQSPRLRSANAHYMIGLGYLGLGDAAKAKAELAQAVEIIPDPLGARTALAALK